jgi:hypothetical protein
MKSLEEFYSDSSRRDSYSHRCKVCDKNKVKKFSDNHPLYKAKVNKKKEKKRKESSYYKKKRENNPLYRLRKAVRDRLYAALITKKTRNTEEIIGCSVEMLKEYLESKFVEGMSWENHGEWHIDHIIPLSSGKTDDEIYKLSHYTNLQPLWKDDNLKKSDKFL